MIENGRRIGDVGRGAYDLGRAASYRLGQANPTCRSDAIFGTVGSSDVLTGMDRGFLAEDLQAGYLLLSDAPATETAKAKLRFDPQDNRIKPKVDGGSNPLKDYAYMVLEFKADRERNDWSQFESLRNAWGALKKRYEDGAKPDEMEELFQQYERACRASPDLLPEDAKIKATKARKRIRTRRGAGRQPAPRASTAPSPADVRRDRLIARPRRRAGTIPAVGG